MKNIPNISFQSTKNKTDFELLRLSELFNRIQTIEDHNPKRSHKISFFALLIVTKGKGKHQIDLIEYTLEEGTVLKIAKGQVHAFEQNPSYDGYLILFTEKFVMNYFSKSSINIIAHLYNYHLVSPIFKHKTANEKLISFLQSELDLETAFAHNNIIAAYLDLYLLQLERLTPNNQILKNQSKQFKLFNEFKSLVESKFTKTRNVKDYANLLFVSTKTLNAAVKEITLNTAKVFIDDYVILEIKRDIVSSNKSLKEIAFSSGFDEVTNFTKFFKNKLGVSPKEFRDKASY